jgi:surface protein
LLLINRLGCCGDRTVGLKVEVLDANKNAIVTTTINEEHSAYVLDLAAGADEWKSVSGAGQSSNFNWKPLVPAAPVAAPAEAGSKFEYDFTVNVPSHHFFGPAIFTIEADGVLVPEDQFTIHVPINSNECWKYPSGRGCASGQIGMTDDDTETQSFWKHIAAGTKLFTITTTKKVSQMAIKYKNPTHAPGWLIEENGVEILKETANRGSAGPQFITYTYDFPKAAVTWEKVSTGVWYSSDGFLTNAKGSHESCKKLCAADANCGCYTGYNGWCQTLRTCTGTEKKTTDPSAVTYRKVADAAVPEPFADSAALKTAVDNCLTAVPSGLDCCKPKSEGGGGADCGAGGHAAIGDWDTSKVTSMNRLFCDCANGNNWCGGVKINRASFNQPIGKWDTSKVTDMDRMFHGQAWNGGTSAFNQPIGDWDVSKVTNMFQMFAYTTAFNQPLDSWDTSSVTNYEYMFVKAKAFNQDISGWKLPRTYRAMFSGADALTLAYYPYPYHPEAKAAAEPEFVLIDEGSCESVGMVTIMDEETCKKAGAVVDNSPGKPVKVVTNRIDRPKGCVLHKFQKGSADKPTELFLAGYLDGCEKGGYDCVCIKPAEAAA